MNTSYLFFSVWFALLECSLFKLFECTPRFLWGVNWTVIYAVALMEILKCVELLGQNYFLLLGRKPKFSVLWTVPKNRGCRSTRTVGQGTSASKLPPLMLPNFHICGEPCGEYLDCGLEFGHPCFILIKESQAIRQNLFSWDIATIKTKTTALDMRVLILYSLYLALLFNPV